MNNKLVLLFVFMGISFATWCQSSKVFNDLGIIIGTGVSHHQGWGIWEPAFGFMVGIETNVYYFNERSTIKAGILFTKQEGPNYKIISNDGYSNSTTIQSQGNASLYYVNFPLLYQFRGRKGFYLEGGVQPGILIIARIDAEDGNSTNAGESFKTFDVGVPVGIGYCFNDRICIGTRAVFGLTDINSADAFEEVPEVFRDALDYTDRSVLLMVVVKFKFR
ncbi:porin family protein [Maribellus mangrovi]|uniref:porin family protein n=1 Tax=Maribellus mangrovi TaxID=3133146 RepID=UPI0030EB2965